MESQYDSLINTACNSYCKAVFPQLKNTFPEMNSEISWNFTQFPKIEEGHSVLVRCHESSQFEQHKCPI